MYGWQIQFFLRKEIAFYIRTHSRSKIALLHLGALGWNVGISPVVRLDVVDSPTNPVLFPLQLSELEQRVVEAEARAEDAEDKVSSRPLATSIIGDNEIPGKQPGHKRQQRKQKAVCCFVAPRLAAIKLSSLCLTVSVFEDATAVLLIQLV